MPRRRRRALREQLLVQPRPNPHTFGSSHVDMARLRRLLGHRGHQHDAVDGGLLAARPRPERGPEHGDGDRGDADHRRARRRLRLDRLAPAPRVHRHVAELLGHARCLLAGAEPRHDGLHLDGHPDVLGRAERQDHPVRHHRAEVLLPAQHAPGVREGRDRRPAQLFYLRDHALAHADGAAGTPPDALPRRLRHGHDRAGRHAHLGAVRGPRRRRSAGHSADLLRLRAELEHALRPQHLPRRLRQRLSGSKRLDALRAHPQRGALRPGHHRPDCYQRNRVVRNSHRQRPGPGLRRHALLEPFPDSDLRTGQHDARCASRHVLRRVGIDGQPDRAVHRAELRRGGDGPDDAVAAVH